MPPHSPSGSASVSKAGIPYKISKSISKQSMWIWNSSPVTTYSAPVLEKGPITAFVGR
jgi:hypothetical protein